MNKPPVTLLDDDNPSVVALSRRHRDLQGAEYRELYQTAEQLQIERDALANRVAILQQIINQQSEQLNRIYAIAKPKSK